MEEIMSSIASNSSIKQIKIKDKSNYAAEFQVHHGGAGTTATGLKAGVNLLSSTLLLLLLLHELDLIFILEKKKTVAFC